MDISSFFKMKEVIKDKKKEVICDNDPVSLLLTDCAENEVIDVADYTMLIDFCRSGGWITGAERVCNILKIIKEKYPDRIDLLTNKLKRVLNKKLHPITSKKLLQEFVKKSEINLSDDQKTGAKKVFKFIVLGIQKCFGLYGYAGSGKTTLIIQLVNFLLNKKMIRSVVFTAPTNKAVNIMKSKFRTELIELVNKKIKIKDTKFDSCLDSLIDMGLRIEFMTVHRLLNYQTEFDEHGNRIFVKKNSTDIFNFDLVFIDECSMLSSDLIGHLFRDLNKNPKKHINTRIIFVGDPAQLCPVNEQYSILFGQDMSEIKNMQKYTLKQIVRSNDDKIIGLCNEVRKYVIGTITKPKIGIFSSKKVRIYRNNGEKTNSEWFNQFIKMKDDRSVSSIILTWTNNQTNVYNNKVRSLCNKAMGLTEKINKFCIGDTLMINDFYNFDESNSSDRQQFYTSEQIRIVSIDDGIKVSPQFDPVLKKGKDMKQFRAIEAKYREIIEQLNKDIVRRYHVDKISAVRGFGDDDTVKMIYVVKDKSKEQLNKDRDIATDRIRKLRHFFEIFYSDKIQQIDKYLIRPLWSEFNKILIEPYANVTLGSSITCHKAQGSTFHNVFVDADDILKNQINDDAKRCIYTALTRASDSVHILI